MALLQNDEESPKVTLWSDPISRSGETFMISLSPFCCVELETSFETLFETFSVLSTCSLVGVVLRILILDSHLFVGVMDAVAFVLVDRVGRFVIVDFEIVSVFDCCFFSLLEPLDKPERYGIRVLFRTRRTRGISGTRTTTTMNAAASDRPRRRQGHHV